jgi:hypothetical protein
MKVSIKGVVIGAIVDIVLSVVFGLPFALYAMSMLDRSQTVGPHGSELVAAAIRRNIPLYAGQLLVGLGCSVLGGYIAAGIAKREELLNGGLSSFLCVGLGIFVVATGKNTDPLFVQVLMLVASPAMALLGGDLRRRQRERTTVQA